MRSKYQQAEAEKLKKQVIKLYKAGLTMREVGNKIGKSRTYVWRIVNQELPDAFIHKNPVK